MFDINYCRLVEEQGALIVGDRRFMLRKIQKRSFRR